MKDHPLNTVNLSAMSSNSTKIYLIIPYACAKEYICIHTSSLFYCHNNISILVIITTIIQYMLNRLIIKFKLNPHYKKGQ